ncbi:MAG: winged helix-turn-helix transcriptional regulator [Candidatus Pacebacteria bacterium]|nr:winged helix-turn-helix transcriptional regulator [Candidatus Paceibacterota bacterium]
MLEELLTKLSLNDKEQSVYRTIAEAGKISTARISRLTNINRTTVYSVCGELKKNGLIKESVGEKVAYWMVRGGGELDRVIAREREALARKEETIGSLKEALKGMPGSKTFSIPKVRYVEEEELETYLYDAVQKWNESILATNQTTWWGFQDHRFVEHYEKWVVWYWKHAPEEIDLKLFSNDSTIESHMVEKNIERRQIRFWENGVEEKSDFTGTLWITGDYITMIQTSERPFYLVEIHDAVLAHNMREVFRKLWR